MIMIHLLLRKVKKMNIKYWNRIQIGLQILDIQCGKHIVSRSYLSSQSQSQSPSSFQSQLLQKQDERFELPGRYSSTPKKVWMKALDAIGTILSEYSSSSSNEKKSFGDENKENLIIKEAVTCYYRILRKIITGDGLRFAKLFNGHIASPEDTTDTATSSSSSSSSSSSITHDSKMTYVSTLNERTIHTILNIIVNVGYMNVSERILKLMRYSSRKIHFVDNVDVNDVDGGENKNGGKNKNN